MMVVKKDLPCTEAPLTTLLRVLSPKCFVVLQVKNKMVSRCRYTREEVLDEVFANADSDFDSESSSYESEDESRKIMLCFQVQLCKS